MEMRSSRGPLEDLIFGFWSQKRQGRPNAGGKSQAKGGLAAELRGSKSKATIGLTDEYVRKYQGQLPAQELGELADSLREKGVDAHTPREGDVRTFVAAYMESRIERVVKKAQKRGKAEEAGKDKLKRKRLDRLGRFVEEAVDEYSPRWEEAGREEDELFDVFEAAYREGVEQAEPRRGRYFEGFIRDYLGAAFEKAVAQYERQQQSVPSQKRIHQVSEELELKIREAGGEATLDKKERAKRFIRENPELLSEAARNYARRASIEDLTGLAARALYYAILTCPEEKKWKARGAVTIETVLEEAYGKNWTAQTGEAAQRRK